MENKFREQLAEFVSPSDFPLFDLVSTQIDALSIVSDIFRDRNSIESASSFNLGVIKSVIALLTDKNVDISKLYDLINDSEDLDDKE